MRLRNLIIGSLFVFNFSILGISSNFNVLDVYAAEITNTWDSGNTTVTLDSEGTLTVTAKPGTDGRMADFGSTNPPWTSKASNVTNIIIDEGVTHIGDSSFVSMKGVTKMDLVIPDSVESLGSYCFGWSTAIQSIKIGSGLREIGSSPYYNCQNIESIEYTGDIGLIKKIGDMSPNGYIKDIRVAPNYTGIPDYFFISIYNTPIEFYIPDTVTYIGNTVFSLTSSDFIIKNIPKNIIHIGNNAFGSSKIDLGSTEIEMPDTLEYIGNSALRYITCTNITQLSNLQYVGENAFVNYEDLGYVGIYSNNNYSIKYYIDTGTFKIIGTPKPGYTLNIQVPSKYRGTHSVYTIEAPDIKDYDTTKFNIYIYSYKDANYKLVLSDDITEINANPFIYSGNSDKISKLILSNVSNLKKNSKLK